MKKRCEICGRYLIGSDRFPRVFVEWDMARVSDNGEPDSLADKDGVPHHGRWFSVCDSCGESFVKSVKG